MDLRTIVFSCAFVDQARRVRSSGLEFWNDAAADAAYRDAELIAVDFEAARLRAMAAGEMAKEDGKGE
jgi:hypothetical protein